MNWIKSLFKKWGTKQGNVSSRFSIEYYPLTERYYPKYGRYYLKTNWQTGIIEKLEDFLFPYAEYGKNEKEANKLIESFKEQYFKENVKTLPVND